MRKIFIRAVSGVVVLLVLIGLLSPLIEAEELFMSIDGLLPSKSDDPIASPVLQEPIWYFGNSWSENLNEPGFVEGRGVGYYKRFFSHSDMSVEFYVYRFSNVSSAEAYCNREINRTKFEGEYTEVLISGAFAVVYDYVTQEIGVSLGIIINIVFKVEVYTANIVEDPTDQLVSFTVLERERILEMGLIPESSPSPSPSLIPESSPSPSPSLIPESSPSPSPSLIPESSPSPSPSLIPESSPSPSPSLIPGLPSFIIITLFTIATALVVIIISRRKQSA